MIAASAPAATAPEDRVPARTKISYGLGGSIDMWGHWLYPNPTYPVFNNFLSGQVLALTGFAADKAVQGPETIFWIRAMLAGIPIAGVCLAALFWWRYPLTQQKVTQIRAQLEARRGKV